MTHDTVAASGTAFAADDPPQALAQLNQQLADEQAKLADLNNRVLTAQATSTR